MNALPVGTFTYHERRTCGNLAVAVSHLPSHYIELLSRLNLCPKSQRRQSGHVQFPDAAFAETVRYLSMDEITHGLPSHTFPVADKCSRQVMETSLLTITDDDRDALHLVAAAKKRKREELTENVVDPTLRKKLKTTNSFPETVSDECQQARIAKFIDATGTNALALSVCCVCAGSFFSTDIREVLVSHLQEKNKLQPFRDHPAHVLTSGMLLHSSSTAFRTTASGDLCGNVCSSCFNYLQRDKTPPHALANGMWVGNVPDELAILTLPERVLVARFFPAAYIVKLYPQQKGSQHWAAEGMQSALRGNISTYRLNTADIVKMTDRQVMPPSSSILAATIGVTFVGPKNVPLKCMPGFLRVNRTHVRVTLEWLQHNNPLYRDIVISPDRLAALPENAVPDEILDVTRSSEDIKALIDESASYVPDDIPEDEGSSSYCLYAFVC